MRVATLLEVFNKIIFIFYFNSDFLIRKQGQLNGKVQGHKILMAGTGSTKEQEMTNENFLCHKLGFE